MLAAKYWDQSLDAPGMTAHQTEDLWNKLISQDGHIRELWVQLRDPASVNRYTAVEEGSQCHPLPPYTHTHAHIHVFS